MAYSSTPVTLTTGYGNVFGSLKVWHVGPTAKNPCFLNFLDMETRAGHGTHLPSMVRRKACMANPTDQIWDLSLVVFSKCPIHGLGDLERGAGASKVFCEEKQCTLGYILHIY